VIELIREASVGAPPEKAWELVSSPARAGDWFDFAERAEVLSGDGVGQLRRQYGHWGRKRAEVDQEVTAFEPPRLIAWRHVAERLDGRPAPQFARSTEFRIVLTPEGPGTRVRLESRQEPASAVKGLVIRLFGSRDVARAMERSLDRLAAALGPGAG
jgi:uncharacterized protein YndB with AHSA1/START domain